MRRAERFEIIIRMIRATQGNVRRVLDLGCGAGTLTELILEAFPQCQVIGVDVDASMLALARPRLEKFGRRVELLHEDLRDKSWLGGAGSGFDAVVSATALHWLSPENLAALYEQLARVIAPGGIFLNADHVGSDWPAIQKDREQHREEMCHQEQHGDSDTWDGFFESYAAALNVDAAGIGEKGIGQWEGIEDGLPLSWHLDRLRECGFVSVDCFWRCDCDAIYGAIRGTG